MKKRTILKNIYICLALFSTVLLVGCSKSDETPISDDPQPSGKGKITFNLHTPVAFLTKAVGVGDENGGTNDKISFLLQSKKLILQYMTLYHRLHPQKQLHNLRHTFVHTYLLRLEEKRDLSLWRVRMRTTFLI